MKQFVIVALLGSAQAFAGVPDKCEIKVTDLKSGESSVTPFEASVGEEKLTTKTVEIKKIKKVVTGRVYYTDEWVGIRWPDENVILDVSGTVRLDVEKKEVKGPFKPVGKGSQTRPIFSNFNDVNPMAFCQKGLNDSDFASKAAPGGNLPLFLDACRAFIDNKGVNTLSVSKTVKGQLIELTCKE